jgi:hypothetical protein
MARPRCKYRTGCKYQARRKRRTPRKGYKTEREGPIRYVPFDVGKFCRNQRYSYLDALEAGDTKTAKLIKKDAAEEGCPWATK